MKKHFFRSVVSLIVALTTLTCSAFAAAAYRRVTPAQAKSMMDNRPEAIILDVRTDEEFSEGHIPGAVLLPDYLVAEEASSTLPNKDSLILVYCRTGIRSAGATRTLLSLGYENVVDFGGLNDWPYEITKN